jgi:hypothetical protein
VDTRTGVFGVGGWIGAFSNWWVDLGRGGSWRLWRIMDATERVLLVLVLASASAVGVSAVGDTWEVGEVGEVGDVGEVGEDGEEGTYCATPLNVSSGTNNGTALSSLGIILGIEREILERVNQL